MPAEGRGCSGDDRSGDEDPEHHSGDLRKDHQEVPHAFHIPTLRSGDVVCIGTEDDVRLILKEDSMI